MIDKRLFKLPKAKIMLAMLAGLMFLQAFAILGQGIFLARAIVGSWKRQPFTEISFQGRKIYDFSSGTDQCY